MISAFGIDHGVISKSHERKKAAAYGVGSAGLAAAAPVAGLGTAIGYVGSDTDHGVKGSKRQLAKHPGASYYKKELKNAKAARRFGRGGIGVTTGLAAGSVGAGAMAVKNIKNRQKT